MARSRYAKRQAKWRSAVARALMDGDTTLHAQLLANPPKPDWEAEADARKANGLPEPRWKKETE